MQPGWRMCVSMILAWEHLGTTQQGKVALKSYLVYRSAMVRRCALLFFGACKGHRSLSKAKQSFLKFEDNGYSEVTVGIRPEVPEDPRLVAIIKDMFVNASYSMYHATRKRAFFRDVIIIVPQTWSNSELYDNIGHVTNRDVDVTITEPLGDDTINIPYTKQYQGCGKPGTSIYVTSTFIYDHDITPTLYGDYGNVLLHEWGHYRWGLFDEYPHGTNFYFSDSNQTWKSIGCSTRREMSPVKLVNSMLTLDRCIYAKCEGNDTTGYGEDCFAVPTKKNQRMYGSVMDRNTHYQVPTFCDGNSSSEIIHDREPPNEQNLFCRGKSSWEVMREHEDFKEKINPARNVPNIIPSFRIVRARSQAVVVVIDTSWAMQVNQRLSRVAQCVGCITNATDPDEKLISIVTFNRKARVATDLKRVFLQVTNKPHHQTTGTCVECGIRKALKLLTHDTETDGTGTIILVTATKGPLNSTELDVVSHLCIKYGIIINAVLFDDSEELFDMAKSTGGEVHLQTDRDDYVGLLTAFRDTIGIHGMEILSRIQDVMMDDDGVCSILGEIYPIYTTMEGGCPIEISTFIDDKKTSHFTIYADVHKCGDPVTGIDVTAIIERPSNEHGDDAVHLKLFDNGAGADLRRNDGVYSRHFTNFTNRGIYGIKVLAKSDDTATINLSSRLDIRLPNSYFGGVSVNAEDLLSGNFSGLYLPGRPMGNLSGDTLGNFSIATSGGAARADVDASSNDVIPPAQITDLRVVSASNATVTLTFTAPGDDLDYGAASQYLFYLSNTREAMLHNDSSTIRHGDILDGDPSSPSVFGTTEKYVIRVNLPTDVETVTYYFAIVAVDDAGNHGDMSIIVQAVFQNLVAQSLSTMASLTTSRNFIPTSPRESNTSPEMTPEVSKTRVFMVTHTPPSAKLWFCQRRREICILMPVGVMICMSGVGIISILVIRKRNVKRKVDIKEDIPMDA